jgi:hypothetical protein
MIIFFKHNSVLVAVKLSSPRVKDMDGNDKNAHEEKKLKLDLSQALTPESDDDDEIIELKDEITPPPKTEESEIDLNDPAAAEPSHDESNEKTVPDINASDTKAAEPENVIQPADEPTFKEPAEPENIIQDVDELTFEEEDESLDDEEIQPLKFEKQLETDDADEVTEITDFDDISSEDVNEMITLADQGEDTEPEEEFLELIDVEEDSLPEGKEADENVDIEDEIIQFDGFNGEVDDDELEDFINESLDKEIIIDDDLEDDLTNSLGIEAGSEMDLLGETSEEEDLDFNIDSKEISKKIDQLDTLFFDETPSRADFADETLPDAELFEEIASDTGDREPEIENADNPPADIDISEGLTQDTGAANLAPEQIEESIERFIQQNFSEKIESMVVKVIEKAVSKEIDRLKNILLEDNSKESS